MTTPRKKPRIPHPQKTRGVGVAKKKAAAKKKSAKKKE
jgi:hypothetical protein